MPYQSGVLTQARIGSGRIGFRGAPVALARLIFAALLFTLLAFLPAPARGQRDSTPQVRVDPRSPRAAVVEFLTLSRRGQLEAAGQFLPSAEPERRRELARRLKAVLDRYLWIEPDLVSPFAVGDTTDGMRTVDRLGTVPGELGVRQPVEMRRQDNADPAWVFTAQTVRLVDAWYDALSDHWLRDRFPEFLQRAGPLGIELWQWVTLIALMPIAFGVGWLFERLTLAIARRAVRQSETMVDDRLLERTAGLLLALWTVLAYRALVEFVGLSIGAEQVVGLAARALSVALVTWVVLRATHVLETEVPASRWGEARPELRSVMPLVGRVTRIFLVAIGGVALIAQFGYSVVTLITGLGIGGIALALAAQKTLEHIFGSVAIGVDQPIRVGDWVKVGDVEGEVEAIGLRSTRIRTMARSQVVFPNGRLADMQMENFGMRDRIILRTELQLTYGSTAEQLRRVRDDVEQLLKDHPLVWPDRIIVRFKGFGAHSLDIEMIAWLDTKDFNVFRAAREEILLRVMEIVERAGTEFAYPTQTLFVRKTD
jgi:MscS family membrane protein